MQIRTLITTLPLLFSLTTAIPVESTELTTASTDTTDATDATDATDRLCLFGKCWGAAKSGQNKCKMDQCFEASAPMTATCSKAGLKAKADIFDQIQCGAVVLGIIGNTPQTCKDCGKQLRALRARALQPRGLQALDLKEFGLLD
ncbi:hypothetical protein FKW77_000502 [Venturia effusa]|uniref:Uncharacterized protein n=1 Tax=Venturia effusa TaxID=50376 RepID=A0A517LA92_9PEZI|nr:hypothetical protein FKW77_000502 [Venturia effusa]